MCGICALAGCSKQAIEAPPPYNVDLSTKGVMSDIIDPVKRRSTLSYWSESEAGTQGAYPGLIKRVADWRARVVEYQYDGANGTLTGVAKNYSYNCSGEYFAIRSAGGIKSALHMG